MDTNYHSDPIRTSASTSVENEEIDIKEVIAKIWLKRKFIVSTTTISFVIGIVIALISPTEYTASCTLVPQTGEKKGGNLSGLAAMAGIDLGGSLSGETLSPAVYPQILKSAPFTRAVMETPIMVSKAGGKSLTVYEYYSSTEYNKPSLVSLIKKYTVGLPSVLFSKQDTENINTVVSYSMDSIQTLSGKEERVHKYIQNAMEFAANKKEGYIELQYTFPEAIGAAQITDAMRRILEQFVIRYKLDKVQKDLDFVEKNFAVARQDYLAKQAQLAAFQDANRNLVSATAAATGKRLSTEYDVAYTVYNELAKQREQARIAVKENKPVLTVIKPVVVPNQKSAPRRGMIIAVFLFLGLIVGASWVLLQPFIRDIVKEIQVKKED